MHIYILALSLSHLTCNIDVFTALIFLLLLTALCITFLIVYVSLNNILTLCLTKHCVSFNLMSVLLRLKISETKLVTSWLYFFIRKATYSTLTKHISRHYIFFQDKKDTTTIYTFSPTLLCRTTCETFQYPPHPPPSLYTQTCSNKPNSEGQIFNSILQNLIEQIFYSVFYYIFCCFFSYILYIFARIMCIKKRREMATFSMSSNCF